MFRLTKMFKKLLVFKVNKIGCKNENILIKLGFQQMFRNKKLK